MDVTPLAGESVGREGGGIDWKSYSTQYDLLARYNPSYQENIATLRSLLPQWNLPPDAAICDLGAGTGNFVCALAHDLPLARFFHVDCDPHMNRVAADKYQREGLTNVSVIEGAAAGVEFAPQSFDLVLCVNALYAMGSQETVLSNVHRWLKPNGIFFVIDFGRQSKLFDWGKYIFGNMYRKEGLGACLRFVKNGYETIRQNRNGSKGQSDGNYWLHSTDEFASFLSDCGFAVEVLSVCYRGYCDLAVCKIKPG